MIKIIDNIIPLSLQNDIRLSLFSQVFPWYYTEDITSDETSEDEKVSALFHNFVQNYEIVSTYHGLIHYIPHIASEKVSFNYTRTYRSRAFLQYPINKALLKNTIDNLHIDDVLDHLVVLYYVCDSDGNTIIVDKKKENNISEYNLKYSDYNILEAVTPKQGRVVIFDGSYYHTAEQPENNMRCVINFNLV